MVLRRTGERRRRVVMDEALQTASEGTEEAVTTSGEEVAKGRRPRQYSRNADRRNLPRCADFVPVSRLKVLAAWCICLGLLLAVNLGFGFLGAKSSETFPRLTEAFGFGARSLSTWLQVLAWAGAAVCCLVIFSIRQHRSNDFRGTYRLWRWLALGCWLLSLAVLVDLLGIAAELAGWLTGKVFATDGVAILALQSLAVVAVAVRLLLELWHSRSAAALLAAAAACSLVACWMELDSLGEKLASNREFVVANLELWGTGLALMSLLVYARFVILHSSGAIYVAERVAKRKGKKRRAAGGKTKRKATSRKRTKKPSAEDEEGAEEEAEDSDWSESETDETEEEEDAAESRSSRRQDSGRGGKSSGNYGRSNADEAESEDEDSDESNQNGPLSRAERKRLKREQRQGRRAA
ncbi:MAG: hypothetical protein ACK493_03550 [Planctomycetota bacterium]|jgi:hypothetical protein|nr:hypothetical protein [Blastopirellula sp.]